MEKIKIELNSVKNKTINVFKQKVEVKPYLSTKDISDITSIFVDNINTNGLEDLAIAKCIFDMFVVDRCTNLIVDGISSRQLEEDTKIVVDLDIEKVSAFDNSRIINVIKPHIDNYGDAFSLLIKSLEMKNVRDSFSIIGKSLPNMDNIGEILNTSMKTLVDFKEKDPKTFEKILNQGFNKQIKEHVVKEIKEEKKGSNKKTTKK